MCVLAGRGHSSDTHVPDLGVYRSVSSDTWEAGWIQASPLHSAASYEL